MDADSPQIKAYYVKRPQSSVDNQRQEYLAKQHDSHIRAGRGHNTKDVESKSSLFIGATKRSRKEAEVIDELVADLEDIDTDKGINDDQVKNRTK